MLPACDGPRACAQANAFRILSIPLHHYNTTHFRKCKYHNSRQISVNSIICRKSNYIDFVHETAPNLVHYLLQNNCRDDIIILKS